MKWIKAIWALRRRYKRRVRLVLLTLFSIWYCFCLPSDLFNDPTCTVVRDARGNILAARIADDGQWRFPELKKVPQKFERAIIEFEDRTFYSHWGVSVKGIGRAIKQNFSEGRIVSGGSTITMQVVRMMRKGKSRSFYQKGLEMILATRVEWRYTKKEILCMYASYAPMGGNVVGLDAASWRYFGRTPDELSWAETATLAVLPNAPSLIFPGKNQPKLLTKRNRLLKRLYEKGDMDITTYQLALTEPLPIKPPDLPQLAPHLADRLMQENKKGENITTTIDPVVQRTVIDALNIHHIRLRENHIYNAACMVLDTKTGKVLAYVGNTVNDDEEHGSDVDCIRAPRSTGSILKPFLYAAMLNEGIATPNQLVPDVPMHFSGYIPKNFARNYDGAVPFGQALARSLNIPALRMLQQYGVARFQRVLKKLGLKTIRFSADHYGLSLILGGAEATLWDLTSAYYGMARTLEDNGRGNGSVYPHYIVSDKQDAKTTDKVFTPASVWFTFHALTGVSRPEGEGNWHDFSSTQKIAWKTGTSFGFRDAWAIGVTGRYVIGVWVGNADGEGRPGLVGIEAAAPILFDVFGRLPSSSWFKRPTEGIVFDHICRQSGYRASAHCTQVDSFRIPTTVINTELCPYHQRVHLSKEANYRVTDACVEVGQMRHEDWFILPPLIEHYYKLKHPSYKVLPPMMEGCGDEGSNRPIAIIYPKPKSKIKVPVLYDGSLSKVIFEIAHRQSEKVVFWHLDEKYLGSTKDLHQLEFTPTPGKHVLTVIDESGTTETRLFEVEEQREK
ncbi:MAG: penicillin-binding protein 1C [Flavobacteriales bacterium]